MDAAREGLYIIYTFCLTPYILVVWCHCYPLLSLFASLCSGTAKQKLCKCNIIAVAAYENFQEVFSGRGARSAPKIEPPWILNYFKFMAFYGWRERRQLT